MKSVICLEKGRGRFFFVSLFVCFCFKWVLRLEAVSVLNVCLRGRIWGSGSHDLKVVSLKETVPKIKRGKDVGLGYT